MEEIVITAAITGAATFPSQSPYIPITPKQIADEAVRAWEAGAAVVHIHARDPEDGRPSASIDHYREIVASIKSRCDVIICITTGAGAGMSIDQRTATISTFKPELASLNMGSMNFSMHPLLKRIKEWKFEWEKPYVEGSRDFVFSNTFASLETITTVMKQHDTKPELEIYDTSHLYNAQFLAQEGFLEYPLHMQFVLGVMGGSQATNYDLVHLKTTADRLFGDRYTWSVIGTGWPHEFRMGAVALTLGGHIRVGLEDNLLISKGQLAKSNAELVEKMRRICEDLGKKVASSEDARAMLQLKGLDKVAF
ncbi:MAG: 3-keto-5-aminohexanoate cleavage protein [Desulfomonile tiedjei]|uniref:3-keto-5-aminohexanoate cleavage protein n=1 Tax=Desulfomonile tiedjei TaxID=2358 RepID=A0A9D6V2J1_9BACT|nr:3-keto-5-aminohexanoate cleavage protein [Desulfomonile tiedjei]